MRRFFLNITFFAIGFFIFACGSGSREYKIEQAKIHLDNAEWDKAIEALEDLKGDAEVYRLRAGAYGGKAGVSIIQLGLKFIGKDGGSGSGDLFSFLDDIGVTSHVNCGDNICISKAITEIGRISASEKKKSDYFVSAFFRFYRASVTFLGIKTYTDMNKFEEEDIKNARAQADYVSCFVNSFEIELAGLKHDLSQAEIIEGDFFESITDMFSKINHCSDYGTGIDGGGVGDVACAADKQDGTPQAGCKWACSTLVILQGGTISGGTKRFDQTLSTNGGTDQCVTDGIVIDVDDTINWTGLDSGDYEHFVTGANNGLTGLEAVAGMLHNTGGGE